MQVRDDLNPASDAAMIASFATKATFRRHDLWPKPVADRVAKFLPHSLAESVGAQKTFYVSHGGEMVALLALRDLPFDTAHYGFKCAAVSWLLSDARFGEKPVNDALREVVQSLIAHARATGIEFLSTSIDSWDAPAAAALHAVQFRPVVNWLEGCMLPDPQTPVPRDPEFSIGPAREGDVGALGKIAAEHYFKGGRFYLDSRFPKEAVDRMYGGMPAVAFAKGDTLLVLRKGDLPVGFFLGTRLGNYASTCGLGVESIRIFALDTRYRDRQLGSMLFTAMIKHLSSSCDLIVTGLESHNLRSLNLHAKVGFRYTYAHNALHWWAKS